MELGRVLFARVGWMRWYRGQRPDDVKPVGGGKYNEDELGYEAFNFLPFDNHVFGYFQPPMRPQIEQEANPSTVRLERIEPRFRGDSLEDVLLIFVATNPDIGGQYIVGWHKGATVYRYEQSSGRTERNCLGYFAKARFEDAVLVPESHRVFAVPRGAGGLGQANICYVHEDDGTPKSNSPWMRKAVDYISSYKRENVELGPR